MGTVSEEEKEVENQDVEMSLSSLCTWPMGTNVQLFFSE